MYRRAGQFGISSALKNFVKREARWRESGPGGFKDHVIWELVEFEVK